MRSVAPRRERRRPSRRRWRPNALRTSPRRSRLVRHGVDPAKRAMVSVDASSDGHAETPSEVVSTGASGLVDGRYRILGRLGAGAMGVVFRAEDVILKRPVALKMIE